MLKLTDKAFRYTASFNTDLRKKFRKLAQAQRAAAASEPVDQPPVRRDLTAAPAGLKSTTSSLRAVR